MKKLFITVAIALTFLSSQLYAQDMGLYVGIGGNYAIQNFDTDEVNQELSPYGLHMNFDDSPGFSARVGYSFSKLFSAELVYDYFSDFSWNQTTIISGTPVTVKMETEIMTFMIAGKLSPNVGSETVRPYITAGAGMMRGKLDLTGTAAGFTASASESESDACGKIGVGIDFYATKNISVGFEGSYVMGFGDMDNIRYTNLNLGVAYHF